MQDPKFNEIVELLELASDVKSRLRAVETQVGFGGTKALSDLDPGSLQRVRNHLELALEALGAPVWGLTAPPAGAMKITGFYSSEIYKALRDVRSGAARGRAGDSRREGEDRRGGPGLGRRKADEEAHEHAVQTGRPLEGETPELPDASEPLFVDAPLYVDRPSGREDAPPAPTGPILVQDARAAEAEPAAEAKDEDTGESSKWVRSRVDEIQRALTAAFGDDELLPDVESQPKPFSAPEFIGNTDVLSVPELVGFFQLQGKTGVLTVDAPHEQFKLEYLRGELIHAASSSSPDGERLGEIIVRLGIISQDQLAELLDGKSDAERLGDAIRRGDLVSDEALAQALEVQVQNIFHRLFDLKGCRFSFREGLEGEPRARVRYNVTRLLLETARHRDEQRQAG